MSTNEPRAERDHDERVGRAVAGVHRDIGRLADLLGEEDPEVLRSAAEALAGLATPAVVGPLAGTLERAGEPRLRAAVALMIGSFAGEAKAPVVLALRRALERETDPVASLVIRRALFSAIGADLAPGPTPGRISPATDPGDY